MSTTTTTTTLVDELLKVMKLLGKDVTGNEIKLDYSCTEERSYHDYSEYHITETVFDVSNATVIRESRTENNCSNTRKNVKRIVYTGKEALEMLKGYYLQYWYQLYSKYADQFEKEEAAARSWRKHEYTKQQLRELTVVQLSGGGVCPDRKILDNLFPC